MAHKNTPALHLSADPRKRSATARKLRRTIYFALVRGAAYATGTGIIGLLFWWITRK